MNDFIQLLVESKRRKRKLVSLIGIIQGENETPRSYLQRFNAKHIKVEDSSPNIVMAALIKGVRHPKLASSLFTKAHPSWML